MNKSISYEIQNKGVLKMKEMLKIRVYKTIDTEGKATYVTKNKITDAGTRAGSIEYLAEILKSEADDFLERLKGKVFIDMIPYHEIEYPNLSPNICLPLTEKEKIEFWKYFRSN